MLGIKIRMSRTSDRMATDWPATENDMQVKPVSAIHPLHIREKQVSAPVSNAQLNASAGGFDAFGMVPVHVAAAALKRDAFHGAHAEYAAQLLADPYTQAATEMERRRYLAQYSAAEDTEREFHSYSVSL